MTSFQLKVFTDNEYSHKLYRADYIGQQLKISTLFERASYLNNYSLNTYTDKSELQSTSKGAYNVLINQLFTVFLGNTAFFHLFLLFRLWSSRNIGFF